MVNTVGFGLQKIYSQKIGEIETANGINLISDSGLETWTDVNTLTNWHKVLDDASCHLIRNTTPDIHNGTYAAELKSDTVSSGKRAYIAQKIPDWKQNFTYRVSFWSRSKSAANCVNSYILNDYIDGSPNQIYNPYSRAWDSWSSGEDIGGETYTPEASTGNFNEYTSTEILTTLYEPVIHIGVMDGHDVVVDDIRIYEDHTYTILTDTLKVGNTIAKATITASDTSDNVAFGEIVVSISYDGTTSEIVGNPLISANGTLNADQVVFFETSGSQVYLKVYGNNGKVITWKANLSLMSLD